MHASDSPQESSHDPPQGRSLRKRLVKQRAFRWGVLALLATMALW